MTPSEVIAKSEKWLQGHMAANDKGEHVDPSSPDACKYCMVGAVYCAFKQHVVDSPPSWGLINFMQCLDDEMTARWSMLYHAKYHGSYGQFNDSPSTTHEDVLDTLRGAERRYRGKYPE